MENANTTPQNSDINIADLDLLRQIVDLASSRGAFRGPELKQVGEVYDKLTRFLEQAATVQKDAEPVSSPVDSTTPQGE
jgi:hypothetical protein